MRSWPAGASASWPRSAATVDPRSPITGEAFKTLLVAMQDLPAESATQMLALQT